jgi:CheY-specific phosphatase CheX
VAEHREPVQAALVDVAENSFFAFVDPLDDTQFAEMAATVPSWLHALVQFDGAFGGRMTIALPEPLAHELFTSFLGEPSETMPQDGPLFDLVGEFGNMVCGSWLTRACQRRRFDLQHPVVTRLEASAVTPQATDLLVALNGQPAILRLSFEEA